MPTRLTFLGAAGQVTGSRYLLQTPDGLVLVDCGIFQERESLGRNWESFPFRPAELKAVILTHAHLDHCGLLPRLVKEGFRGRIYCTGATAEIARIVLADAGSLQEEDAAFKRRRHEKEGREGPHPAVPLYTREDAEKVFPHFRRERFGRLIPVTQNMKMTLLEAGHILGAASVVLDIQEGGRRIRLVFSGDIGRPGMPLLRDPQWPPADADYVVVESTYGNRLHGPNENIPTELAGVIQRAHAEGGNVVIPTFAVERSQDVLYHLHKLLLDDRIPHTMVFMDSPMAIQVTEVFKRNRDLLDEEATAMLNQGKSPCDFPGLSLCRTVAESKAINHIKGSIVVMAGSGMCTGGRIKHHLAANISRPESTILFVGYQAAGTLGRLILDGTPEVRIHGQTHPVRAKIIQIDGFSGHADQKELLAWLGACGGSPKQVFVTHGEPNAAGTLIKQMKSELGLAGRMPVFGETAVLS